MEMEKSMTETEEMKKISSHNRFLKKDRNILFIEQFAEIKKAFLLNHKRDKRIYKKGEISNFPLKES